MITIPCMKIFFCGECGTQLLFTNEKNVFYCSNCDKKISINEVVDAEDYNEYYWGVEKVE